MDYKMDNEYLDKLWNAGKEAEKKHYDPRKKVQGDKIIVWDFSSFSNLRDDDNNLDMTKKNGDVEYFMVTNTHIRRTINNAEKAFPDGVYQALLKEAEKRKMDTAELEKAFEFTQDLEIVNPKTCEYYRVNSDHVKIID